MEYRGVQEWVREVVLNVKETNAGHVQLDGSVRNLVGQEGSKIMQ